MYVDSPLELCRRHGCYVLLDQTLRECAAEHHCLSPETECPLKAHFSGIEFEPAAAPADRRSTRRTR